MQKQMSGFYSDQQQFVTFLCLTKGGEKKTPGKTVRMQNIPPQIYMLHLQGYLIDEPIKTAVNHFESVVNYSLSSKSSP